MCKDPSRAIATRRRAVAMLIWVSVSSMLKSGAATFDAHPVAARFVNVALPGATAQLGAEVTSPASATGRGKCLLRR
jgi:hypothetical protein